MWRKNRKGVSRLVACLVVLGFVTSFSFWFLWYYNRPLIRVIDYSSERVGEPPDFGVQITATFRNEGLVSGSSQFKFYIEWPGGEDSEAKTVSLEPRQITTVTVTLKATNDELRVGIDPS